jgi:signal peptide peptidase SppA
VDALKYAHIAARILSRPLLLEPGYAQIFFSAFGNRAGFSTLVTDIELNAEGMRQLAESYQVRANRFASGQYEPYAIMGDGVAVVSIEGSLVHKTGALEPESGMQGYDGVRAKIDAAMQDPRVKGVLLNIDSPGGEVSGAFDMADYLASAKKRKPIWSYAGDMMASAAYLIGSQTDRVLASQTAYVGSVGVLMAHADKSQQMEQDGVKVTLLYSGAHKVDGNPYSALPDHVRETMQGELDDLRNKFASRVAAGRSMSTEAVLKTEAKTYTSAEAQGVGFVDGVASFDETIALFSQTLAGSGSKSPRGKQMSDQLTATAAGLSDSEVEKLMSDALAEGKKLGASEERARIQGILTHAEADGRGATAQHLAFATDMGASAAVSLLATMPKAASAAVLAQGMTEGAGVRAEAHAEDKPSADQLAANATKAALSKLLKR